ncbi:hypothetical protein CNMCM7691_003898 [Aspergillus felis]|uniref:Quinone oxidoreductase n=1 Tax=Aspergillus felis TaxID=1287682 RepID=A0A8H6R3B5_9EURO|nr:hypothetical protein CNMCM7691_003898 [Aspergillus felis]
MKAALVTAWGSPPSCINTSDLPPPLPSQLQLKVLAAAIPRVVQLRASRKHSSASTAVLPFDPSIDGVGIDEATGQKYFIPTLAAPVFAERANVDRSQLIQLPAEADAVTIAALANPVTSSWMALRCRTVDGSCLHRTVLILGATSASGRAAAFVARLLGASRVVGVSRCRQTLDCVEGLDERVVLPPGEGPWAMPDSVGPVQVVLDYVGGPAAIRVMQAVKIGKEDLQYIIIGGLAGQENLDLPMRMVNTRPIRIMGSGIGSLRREEISHEMEGLVGAIVEVAAKMEELPFEVLPVPLAEIHAVWGKEAIMNKKRVVLVP